MKKLFFIFAAIIGLSIFAGDKIALSFDFRPGYGLGFYNAEGSG